MRTGLIINENHNRYFYDKTKKTVIGPEYVSVQEVSFYTDEYVEESNLCLITDTDGDSIWISLDTELALEAFGVMAQNISRIYADKPMLVEFNGDTARIVTDWYRQSLGTFIDGSGREVNLELEYRYYSKQALSEMNRVVSSLKSAGFEVVKETIPLMLNSYYENSVMSIYFNDIKFNYGVLSARNDKNMYNFMKVVYDDDVPD